MHVYSKSITWFIATVAFASYASAPAATIALNVPKATAGTCSAYALCIVQGALSAGRSPAGSYGFVTRPDGKCVALLLDTKLFARAKTMSGTTLRIEGIALARLPVADGVISSAYFDRTLVEGGCSDQAVVIYVTRISRAV